MDFNRGIAKQQKLFWKILRLIKRGFQKYASNFKKMVDQRLNTQLKTFEGTLGKLCIKLDLRKAFIKLDKMSY